MNLPDNPQIYIVIAFMVIGGVRWILEQINGAGKQPDATEDEDDPYADSEDLYEEARREIIARQHQLPQPSAPPPIPIPLVVQPSTPSAPPLSDWNRSVKAPPLSATERVALAKFQVHPGASSRHTPQRRTTGSRIKTLLATPSSARDAILLSEILGPPKGAL